MLKRIFSESHAQTVTGRVSLAVQLYYCNVKMLFKVYVSILINMGRMSRCRK